MSENQWFIPSKLLNRTKGYNLLPTSRPGTEGVGVYRLRKLWLLCLPILGILMIFICWEHIQDWTDPRSWDFQRGWTESMGWKQDPSKGLTDLGQAAEDLYRIYAPNAGTYYDQLKDFTYRLPTKHHEPFLNSLEAHFPSMSGYEGNSPALYLKDYKTIFQTDKFTSEDAEISGRAWKKSNPDWDIRFLDDEGAYQWVQKQFGGSDIAWAWEFMRRGVLRADFLRYLLPLVEGGIYSDVDTVPIRPISQWGKRQVEILDLHETDGPQWRSTLQKEPSVIIGIDVDVHAHPSWQGEWPRPVDICQWTLGSSPNHPIFIDAARRVVNNTRVVEEWEKTPDHGWNRAEVMKVLEWTGPGMFTDSVFAFLKARYNVSWHRLRGLERPLRIGDVLILPIASFSPGGEEDFHSEGRNSPFAYVLHDFRGSWKSEGF